MSIKEAYGYACPYAKASIISLTNCLIARTENKCSRFPLLGTPTPKSWPLIEENKPERNLQRNTILIPLIPFLLHGLNPQLSFFYSSSANTYAVIAMRLSSHAAKGVDRMAVGLMAKRPTDTDFLNHLQQYLHGCICTGSVPSQSRSDKYMHPSWLWDTYKL